MKPTYVKITIEAPVFDAKAAAENYGKDRKYTVLSKSKPYPCEGTSNVRIYLHVVKKTQLGCQHNSGRDNQKHKKKKNQKPINYEALMMPSY